MEEILTRLLAQRDEPYAVFQRRLLPTLPPGSILGVRTPALRKFAKELSRQPIAAAFRAALPHTYFEENQLHAFLLAEMRPFEACLEQTERFLPYVDNWATCDQLSPRIFAQDPETLLPSIEAWLSSEHVYTVRFGVGMLMRYFLDERFDPRYARMVESVRSEEYYVNMMLAWYFATALAKQYDAVVPVLEQGRLDRWVHNKTIQKAVESYRIPDERKAYLRTLRRK